MDGGIGIDADMAAPGLAVRVEPMVAKLHRVRATVCSMLEKRGYAVAADDIGMDLASFASKVGGSSLLSLVRMNPRRTAWKYPSRDLHAFRHSSIICPRDSQFADEGAMIKERM